MGQRSWHFEDNPQQIFHFADELPISLNLLETVQVSKQLPQGKRPTNNSKENPSVKRPLRVPNSVFKTPIRHKIPLPDFEESGPDYGMQNDYSPRTIQAVFKDSLPVNVVTSDRKYQADLFSGVVYRPDCQDKDPIFVPLYSFDYKILKSTDGIPVER